MSSDNQKLPSIQIDVEGITQENLCIESRNIVEEAKLILKKPNQQRTQKDTETLLDCFKNLQFFREIKEKYWQSVLYNLCKNMTLETLPASTVLFSLGDFGTKFYIILSGQVSVKILQRQKSDPDDSTKHKETKRVLTEVKVLKQGETFGEMALIGDGHRLATIESKEKCVFAVIDKQTFMSFLKLDEESKISTEVGFMSQVDIIKNWNYPDLLSLYLLTSTQAFSNGETVYKQGDLSQFVYIIRSGIFKLYKTSTIWMPSKMDEKLIELVGHRSNLYQQISRTFEISVIEVPEIVGDEEIVNNCKRKYTLKCVSGTGSVIALSKSTFLEKICTDFNRQFYFKRKLRNLNKTRLDRLIQLKNRIFDFPNQLSYLNKEDCNCVIQKESERILKEISLKRNKQGKGQTENQNPDNYTNELLQSIIKQIETDLQEQSQQSQNKNQLAIQASYLEQNSGTPLSISQTSEKESQKHFNIQIANQSLSKFVLNKKIHHFQNQNLTNITPTTNQESLIAQQNNYGAKSTELPTKTLQQSKSLGQLSLRLKLPIVKSFEEQNQLLQGLKQRFRKKQLHEEQNVVEFQNLFFKSTESKQQQIEKKKDQFNDIRSMKKEKNGIYEKLKPQTDEKEELISKIQQVKNRRQQNSNDILNCMIECDKNTLGHFKSAKKLLDYKIFMKLVSMKGYNQAKKINLGPQNTCDAQAKISSTYNQILQPKSQHQSQIILSDYNSKCLNGSQTPYNSRLSQLHSKLKIIRSQSNSKIDSFFISDISNSQINQIQLPNLKEDKKFCNFVQDQRSLNTNKLSVKFKPKHINLIKQVTQGQNFNTKTFYTPSRFLVNYPDKQN